MKKPRFKFDKNGNMYVTAYGALGNLKQKNIYEAIYEKIKEEEEDK